MTGLPTEEEEKELLEALSGSRTRDPAFRRLVAVYGPLLHRHLLRMVQSAADTDDILQDVFIKVFRNLDKFRGESKLSTWLYRIATNEALSFLRSSKRRGKRISSYDPQSFVASTQRAEPYFDGDEAQRRLHAALDQLPEKQRAVFIFRYFDELPYAEISAITGTSEGGLKASYHLAVKKIEQNLKAYAA